MAMGSELRGGLRAALNPLERRLRGALLDGIARAALERSADLQTLRGRADVERWAEFACLLTDYARALGAARVQRKDRFEVLSRACADAPTSLRRDELMKAYIKKTAPSAWSGWRDRRALRRRLDLGALRERVEESAEVDAIGIELAMAGATHYWIKALGVNPEITKPIFLSFASLEDWQKPLESELKWSRRLKAASQLARLARLPVLRQDLLPLVESLWPRLCDEQEHPWVRRSLLMFVSSLAPQRALDVARVTLNPGAESQKHAFLARMLFLEFYSRRVKEERSAADLLLEHWERVDPSEHLRLRLAEYLGRFDPLSPGLMNALLRRCIPGEHADSSARVRAQLVHSAGQLMRECLNREDSQAPEHPVPAAYGYAVLIDAVLAREEHGAVLLAACTEVTSTVNQLASFEQLELHANLVQGFEDSLIQFRQRPGVPASIEEKAAAAQEDIALTVDPIARQAVGVLRHHLRSMQVGERRKLERKGAFAQISELTLGRVLAHLSRDDWGLYVESHPSCLWLQRGDRRVTRAWRIWHELRHPLPNKRKGFVHTTGRIFHGELRAHPLRLDEATTTLVPGERVSIPQDQGCARHLPFVDDLISRPGLEPGAKIQLFSSLGVTSIRARPRAARRGALGLRIQRDYAKLSALRRSCLLSDDPAEQKRYVETLSRKYGVEVKFHPYRARAPVSQRSTALFDQPRRSRQAGTFAGLFAMAFVSWDAQDWVARNAEYFRTSRGNDQLALSIFATVVLAAFLIHGFIRRDRIRRARAKIPLSIGGWGTRGKSGTERLKAAMLHGLGYRVFSKTTGCEAMLVHSVAAGSMSEIFVFRPYGKATIWEQRDLLQLAAKLPTDVFLWECMALNPNYVSILQRSWMKDDLATITNAYPDHEDIQGPAGIDVAEVIAKFVPQKSVLVSSEVNFSPIFRDEAAKQETRYVQVDEEAELKFGEDLLELFPYQEHPRNIALVASLGEELGVDRDLSVYNMASYVLPDLGVLKTYGDAKVLGRTLRFINGCSANERAGFMSNWTRTGCDAFDAELQPHKMLALVVNNRADRISRSEVFSKILVQDAACDRMILIGTNLGGLRSFIERALSERLDELAAALTADEAEQCLERFEVYMRRHRCPGPKAVSLVERLKHYAKGVGVLPSADALNDVRKLVSELLDDAITAPLSVESARNMLCENQSLSSALDRVLKDGRAWPGRDAGLPECIEAAAPDCAIDGFLHQLARTLVLHRLRLDLREVVAGNVKAEFERFRKNFKSGYRSLFTDSLVTLQHAGAKGDEVLEFCARSVPPGVELTLMGSQNIKGTGLDFVYRWVALDQVQHWIEGVKSGSSAQRALGWRKLESFGDHGAMDLALIASELDAMTPQGQQEEAVHRRLCDKVKLERATRQPRSKRRQASPWKPLLRLLEAALDFLDGARRYHQSQSLKRDLIARRVSHERATSEMRELYDRAKGDWLSGR